MGKFRLIYLFILILLPVRFTGQVPTVGQRAPEIVQQSLNGDSLALSSLKGKMVLIDFWASWCGPCRRENPYIIKAYEKYADATFKNGNGFTVFSVSLDFRQNDWERAIKADSLVWPYHVCDFKGWRNAAAQLYNVSGIPANFLIDGDGVIVGVNLRGEALEEKLKKLEKKAWRNFF